MSKSNSGLYQGTTGSLAFFKGSSEYAYQAISSCKDNPRLKNSNPMLYTQFILYDYYKSLSKAVINEVKWGKMVTYGNWGFVFSKPRNGQKYPVVKHAKFNGLH